VAITDNLVACWPLEADGTDATGRGNTLTNVGATFVAGKVGNCADLEETENDFLWRGDNADLSMGAGVDCTICVWVRPETVNAGISTYFVTKYLTTGNQREYALLRFGDGVTHRYRFQASSAGTLATLSAVMDNTVVPTAGEWVFIVGQHNAAAATISISVNAGTPVTAAHAGGIYNGAADLCLGRASGSTGNDWDGLIDQLCIWKSAPGGGGVKTAAEITWLFNAGAGRTYAEMVAGMPGLLLFDYGKDGKQSGRGGRRQ